MEGGPVVIVNGRLGEGAPLDSHPSTLIASTFLMTTLHLLTHAVMLNVDDVLGTFHFTNGVEVMKTQRRFCIGSKSTKCKVRVSKFSIKTEPLFAGRGRP